MMRRTQKMLIVFAVLLTAPDRPVRGAKAPDRPAAGIADPVVTLATGRMDQRLV